MADEHLKTLDAALEQLRAQRRALAEKLADDYNRSFSDGWRDQFIQTQQAIEALHRAIEDEKSLKPQRGYSVPLNI
ncbi:flagellar biosynthesis chaperone FliJ [Sinorhizobium fredii]